MNIVDAVLAAVLCVFAARGYVKGLFREVFALVGLAAGLFASLRYYELVSGWVDFWPYSPLILQGIVFAVIFLLIYIALNWVGFLLHRVANVLFLVGLDRVGGLLMGGSKGALLLGVALFVTISQSWVPRNFQQQFDGAALVSPLSDVGAWVAEKGAAVTWPGAIVPTVPDSTVDDWQRGA